MDHIYFTKPKKSVVVRWDLNYRLGHPTGWVVPLIPGQAEMSELLWWRHEFSLIQSLGAEEESRRRNSHMELFFKATLSHASSASSLITSGVECESPSPTHHHRGTDNAV